MVSPTSPRRSDLYSRPSYLHIIGRIAANVRRLREARDWTQIVAATHCDMAPYQYQKVEAGRYNVTSTTLSRLTDGFAVDVAEFFIAAPPLARHKPRERKPPVAPPEPETK